jgi:hypothetical protein
MASSMASKYTRSQRETLSVLRSLLRHVRLHVDNRAGIAAPAAASPPSAAEPSAGDAITHGISTSNGSDDASMVRDTREFTQFIMQQYRAHQHTGPATAAAMTSAGSGSGSGAPDARKSRAEIKAARKAAADVLASFTAVAEQAALQHRHRGFDADAPTQRAATARFVGLTIPERAPVGRTAEEVVATYAATLKAREGDISRLSGLEYLKAQYYGPPKLQTSAGANVNANANAQAEPAAEPNHSAPRGATDAPRTNNSRSSSDGAASRGSTSDAADSSSGDGAAASAQRQQLR